MTAVVSNNQKILSFLMHCTSLPIKNLIYQLYGKQKDTRGAP
jgi:hypothetical protein